MPRAARPDKGDWRSNLRTREKIRKRLLQLALDLEIPAEEIADYILSKGLDEIPFREVVLPMRSKRSTGAA